MKNRAIISERGTITIPEPIRKSANIYPGDLIEFKPERGKIILTHLIVKYSNDDETHINNEEWNKFDKLVHNQLDKGKYKSYSDLEKAKKHSRKLIDKK